MPHASGPILQVQGLSKRFGAVVASDAVDLEVGADELHAVIGPNGAGKTTLIGQLAGEIRADSGSIRFDGAEVSGLPAHLRARRGLARSFQVTSLFPRFTALENVALAVQARERGTLRVWTPAWADMRLIRPAWEALEQVGLSHRADVAAQQLAHGEQRQLEIALALATRPRLLLLDEPTAGMGHEESGRMVELLERLRGNLAMLLIEHDMDAVFRLAERITVLVDGRAVAQGAPDAVRRDPEVRRAYLGADDLADADGQEVR